MSETIILAMIGVVSTLATGLITVAVAKINRVHKIVNSQRTEMLGAIEALKAEVARLQYSGGNTPTTRQEPDPTAVTIRDGNVTVSKDEL